MSIGDTIFYKLKLSDPESRKAIIKKHIKEHQSNTKRHEEPFFIKQRFVQCPVVKLSIDLPVYHMNNGRTRRRQRNYIAQNSKKDKFFSDNQENKLQQELQHEILFDLSQESTANIYKELKTSRNFREDAPILLDNTGMVVNGNRRLSAVRELYTSDPKKFHMFKNIPCAIIQEIIHPKDVKDIENFLQVKKENKAEYDWISLALEIKDEKDRLKLSNKEIAQSMGMSENEIQRQLDMIEQIEICLEEDWKKPKDYELLINQKQLWLNTSDRAKKKKSPIDSKAVYITGRWCSINAKDTDERIYTKAGVLQKPTNLKSAMEWIMNRQHIKPVKNKSKDNILGELEDKEELYNLTNLNKIKIKKNQLDDINQLVDYLQDESDDKAPLKSSKTILDKIIKLSGLKLPQSDRKEIAKNLKKTVMHANRIIGKAEK